MAEIFLQTDDDLNAIEALMADVFGQNRHARTVWNLRPGKPVDALCFILRESDEIVGSLRFWEVRLGTQTILLLGPLAISQKLRGKGFGKALISKALTLAREGPWPLVLVSGEADYYPKFGFIPAASYQLDWPGFIEPERLQFFELKDGALAALPKGPLPVREMTEAKL
ncbi:MAG: GNAT family N-acetyltransferase [Bacteroidetes bacterium]|jgi:predicted N-acetyltransferase YhbS|nr:GNAT family N-acetyltransferase [Bacteroidota bacterium]